MRLLLDTHVALWAITDSPQLPPKIRCLILDPDNDIVVSAASIWEISIKHGLARGNMPISGEEALQYFRNAGYQLLPISADHAALVENLPPHHADPFDRILLAQAIHEPIRLLTHDTLMARYDAPMHMV